jgi:hypothetical protein
MSDSSEGPWITLWKGVMSKELRTLLTSIHFHIIFMRPIYNYYTLFITSRK